MKNEKLSNKTLSGIGNLLGKLRSKLEDNHATDTYIDFEVTMYSSGDIKYSVYTEDEWYSDIKSKQGLIDMLNKKIKE